MKQILITAGSTATPIDQVRNTIPWYRDVSSEVSIAITNIFNGRTGSDIADYFSRQKNKVALITSNISFVKDRNIKIIKFYTYSELLEKMQLEICSGKYDIIIHSAAVSDYIVTGVMIKNKMGELIKLDSSRKVSSQYPELYLKMTPTIKIIDEIRYRWNFKGHLVKFKLEVGKNNSELIRIAKNSMQQSKANLIVANCLSWSRKAAFLFNNKGQQWMVKREYLAQELYQEIMAEL